MLTPFRFRGITPYVIGIAGVIIATVLRSLFDPVLGEHLSFTFDYLAVFVAAWTGGLWPAVVTAVVSALISNYFFTNPYQSLEISSVEEFLDLSFFVAVSVIIGALSEISLRALGRAKQAEREKDNFMATLAHEMRSPISVIYYANALNRIAASDQPNNQLDVIDRQVQHLNLMIEDLLDVSRVARGKIRLDRRHMEVSAIVAGAIEKARPLIDAHKHTLTVDISTEPMAIHADPARMEQVVTNLLTNAAKYTPDGGQIVIRAVPSGDSAILSVKDNGLGIAPDMLPKVFDLFVQADAAGDRTEGGLGIGLALARKITEMHGGKVQAVSNGKNCGSEFLVTLPLETRAAVPSAFAEV